MPTDDPVDTATCFVLGYIANDFNKGLRGSVKNIKDGIKRAKDRFNLRDAQVAVLYARFNVQA